MGQPESENVGARIRRLRLEQGRSQREIEGPGADHAHISRVERGERTATEAFLRTVARNLGVSVAYLRHGETGSEADRRRARLDDVELTLRLDAHADRLTLVDELRALHAEAVADGDFGVARRCRILIGCSASERGEHVTAERELSRLVADGQVSPLAEAEVYLCLGRSLAALGRADESVALFEACLASVQPSNRGDSVAFVRFSTYLSYALADSGELRRAKEVLKSALAVADGVDDTMTRVRVYLSRARLAWTECDWDHGRAYAARAIALLEATEDAQDLLRMHLLVADIGLLVGELDAAEASLEKAKCLGDASVDAQDMATSRRIEAFVAARRGDGDAATTLASEAIELLAEDEPARGRAYWALAEGLVARGEHDEALLAFRTAYELMSVEKRFVPQLLHAWVSTLTALDRHEEVSAIVLETLEAGALAPTVS